jgi:hypothetical protein
MTEIQKFMMATFVRVRVGVGVIGICFPFLLWGIGGIRYHLPLAGSMSAYYHATLECMDTGSGETCKALDCSDPNNLTTCKVTEPPTGMGPMRNWFVGILFIMGACLYLIHGFSIWEKIFLNLAGMFAVMVALNPMPWVVGKASGFPIHYVSAMSFFGMIACVCLFCSGKTLKYMPDCPNRAEIIKRYKWAYRLLGVSMLVSPLMGGIFSYVTKQNNKTFATEALGTIAFGVYWILKTEELDRSGVERRAMRGEIEIDPKRLL